jgi:hypothetical protein
VVTNKGSINKLIILEKSSYLKEMQKVIRSLKRQGLQKARANLLSQTKSMTVAPQFNFATGKEFPMF